MQESDVGKVGQLSDNNPKAFQSLVMKRALDFKDPSLTKRPNTQIWNSIGNMPRDKIKTYARPQIIARDKQACEHIVKKLEEEKIIDAISKQWYVQER